MENKIKLAYLFPDILNLHGDRGNVLAFERLADKMGLPFEWVRIDNPNTKINLKEYDIILLSPGELKSIEALSKTLSGYKEDIKDFIDEDRYIIATGTSIVLFGNEVKRIDKNSFEGLGIVDMRASEREWVYGDDLLFSFGDTEITSCQIQMVDIEIGMNEKALGEVKYGMGNNNSDKEGLRKNNLILTNALGPVFVKNPWFARDILVDAADKKELKCDLSKLDFSLELSSKETIEEFVLSKQG